MGRKACDMTTLRIGELANKGNVHLETIRYYEREGLLRPPQRTPSGHRAYAPGDLLRLRFIKRSQALGFTLTEIKELLALKVTPNQPCIDGKRSAHPGVLIPAGGPTSGSEFGNFGECSPIQSGQHRGKIVPQRRIQ